MTFITIDRSTGDRLRGVNGPVQLRDERGEVLGEFRPATDRVSHSAIECPLDEAELRRREQETTSFSTDEVLRHLGTL